MVSIRTVRRQMLVIFLVTVAAFAFLGWRVQESLTELRDYVHAACESRAANVERLNAQARAFIEIERDNPFRVTSPETIARRIEIYEASILDVPKC